MMLQLVLEIVWLLAALFVKDSLATTSGCKTKLKVCSTPDEWQGDCINIKECPALLKIVTNRKRTAAETTFLQQSQCANRIGDDVFTCCRYQRNNLLPDTKDCGQTFENRIVGGTPTNIDEYPWVAMLEFTYPGNKKRYECGGSLINNRYVLTAAHCIENAKTLRGSLSSIRLGEWNTTTNPDCVETRNGVKACADPHLDVGIKKIHVHPFFRKKATGEDPVGYNDITLVRLDRNVIFTDFIRPICLPVRPHQRSQTFDGVEMQVSGWGFTEAGVRSILKRKLNIKGVEFKSCLEKFSSQGRLLKEPQMCAGGESGKDSCTTDSGGPLMAKQCVDSRDAYVLAGIVSFGPEHCGTAGFPGVYTRVGPYMEWIESLLQP